MEVISSPDLLCCLDGQSLWDCKAGDSGLSAPQNTTYRKDGRQGNMDLYRLIIGGEKIETDRTFGVRNPATGKSIMRNGAVNLTEE
jgi:hypothetical protein